MKKLAFALLLALPMMFASCSKDDDKDTFDFVEPVQTWGATSDAVKLSVNKQSTDKKLDLVMSSVSTETAIMFVTPKNATAWQLPWYGYYFSDNDELEMADYMVDKKYASEMEKWLDKKYHRYAAEEGDEFITYGNTKNEADCTLYVYFEDYGVIDSDGETVLFDSVLGTWQPITEEDEAAFRKTRGMTKRQFAREKVENKARKIAI